MIKEKLISVLMLSILLFAVFPDTVLSESGYIIHDQHIYPIEFTEKNDIQYVSLKRLKDIFNARLTFDKTRNSYIYRYKNRQCVLAPGKSLISVEGRLEFVSQPVIESGSDLLVPVEFIRKILPMIHFIPVEYNESSKAFIFGENSDPYNLKVNVLGRTEYQRLIVQAKETIPFRITRDNEIIKIKFLRKIILLPFKSKKLSDDIISEVSFEQESDSTILKIVLRDDPEDIKSMRFNNPFRIVLNFMRQKDKPERDTRQGTSPFDTRSWLESTELRTVVIDPGHGGENEGAIGPSGMLEKNITLQVARRLKRIIEENIPNVKVVLTRDRDIDLSLKARTETTNNNKADLFISIHCNGSVKRNARGAEVYILSNDASDEAARVLAAMENQGAPASIGTQKGSRSSLTPILWELTQNEYMRESARLADQMQSELNQLLNTPERGVKQAPFSILTGAIMPAVLVEIAFITNPEEEQKLKDSGYQDSIARALYRSILRFQSLRDRKMSTGYSEDDND